MRVNVCVMGAVVCLCVYVVFVCVYYAYVLGCLWDVRLLVSFVGFFRNGRGSEVCFFLVEIFVFVEGWFEVV